MRKFIVFFASAILVLLGNCKKESENPEENFIKAVIDDQQFVVYENVGLNTDTVPNTFSFSFGQSISVSEEINDTSLCLSACLNRRYLEISFPKISKPVTFYVYRSTNLHEQPFAYYAQVPKTSENGLVGYYTHIMSDTENTEKQKVGEISVSRIDWESREIRGTFSFTATGYEVAAQEYFVPINKSVTVSNGEFYYRWDETLPIE